MNLYCNEMSSPVGRLTLLANDSALVEILWQDDERHQTRLTGAEKSTRHPILASAEQELAEYFAGERTQFDVPLQMAGTDFQQRVWRQLQQIPFGICISYGELAKAIDQPKASRAVGAANGQNPIPIIVPCHRVIGQNGKLTGFGGGLTIKAQLIALEQRVKPMPESLFARL